MHRIAIRFFDSRPGAKPLHEIRAALARLLIPEAATHG
jgi:hypothetical protein